MDVKYYGAEGEAVESLCSEQESSEQVLFCEMHIGDLNIDFCAF